jgi:hypothetical protein
VQCISSLKLLARLGHHDRPVNPAADALEQVNGTWQRVNLHCNKKADQPDQPPCWQRPASGTNIVESVHAQLHNMFTHSGGNISPAQMENVIYQFVWGWNVKIMARRGMVDPACAAVRDPLLMLDINEASVKLGLPVPFRGIVRHSALAYNEEFGFNWKKSLVPAGARDTCRVVLWVLGLWQQIIIVAAEHGLPEVCGCSSGESSVSFHNMPLLCSACRA